MRRRTFVTGAAGAWAASAPAARPSAMPPRKVIVGTVVQGFWVKYPGLEKRLEELAGLVEEIRAASLRKYGRGPDLAVLPEVAVTGETGSETRERAVPWEGPLGRVFERQARELNSYLIVPTYLREADGSGRCSNAAVLVGRRGKVEGIYRKVHLVVGADGKTMEGGATAGNELPVFACDFGKLAIQICYDMEFDRGWRELARKGAELVAWPTQSPQTTHPAARAMEGRCYVVSSTWRDNATIFEPTGKIAAQVRPPGRILVEEIDLSYAILPWSSRLRKGKLLEERYGAKVGFRYYEDEDCGLFWSNDPKTPIRTMVEAAGLREDDEELARVRQAYHGAKVLDY